MLNFSKYLIFTGLLFTSFVLQAEEVKKTPLLIDCDADLDDLIAILYAISCDQINLLGITTTGNGKSHSEFGAKNILKVLDLIDQKETPVAKSNKPPLDFNGFHPNESRKNADELYNLKIKSTNLEPVDLISSDFMIEQILSSKEKVSILCTGPLTNLALAIKKEPAIVTNIEQVLVIGGAVNVKGNITQKHNGYYNRLAEYNMFLDGKAAQEVFRSGIKITLIPLDVLSCTSLMNTELYRHLVKIENRSKIVDFVFSGLNQLNYPFFGMNKSLYFLSSIGVYLLSNNEFAEVIPLKLRINLDYGPYYGMLSLDRAGFLLNVCLNLDYDRYLQHFIKTIKK